MPHYQSLSPATPCVTLTDLWVFCIGVDPKPQFALETFMILADGLHVQNTTAPFHNICMSLNSNLSHFLNFYLVVGEGGRVQAQ